jgi:hypothetical protein
VEGPTHKLLESLATSICRRIMEEHTRVEAVRLQLSKPHVAVPGVLQSLGEPLQMGHTQVQLVTVLPAFMLTCCCCCCRRGSGSGCAGSCVFAR